jgi:hypothetical protein
MIEIVNIIVSILGLYFGFGVLFGVYFVIHGAVKLDPIIGESNLSIRFLLFPGAIVTWPFLVLKLLHVEFEKDRSNISRLHRTIWMVLILVIPIMIYFSIKDLQYFPKHDHALISNKFPVSERIKFAEDEFIKAALYGLGSENVQLEITLKNPLKHPIVAVHILDENYTKGDFIGLLNSASKYYFPAYPSIKGILLYDTIKDEVITKMEFQ